MTFGSYITKIPVLSVVVLSWVMATGGPPMLGAEQVIVLLRTMVKIGCLDANEVISDVRRAVPLGPIGVKLP